MTREEELRLIERVLSGEPDAFEPLVLEHQGRVYSIALKLMGNEQDASDAAQEAFLKAYTSLGDYRAESRFAAWLYRLTNNVCIDLLRKRKRTAAVSLQQEDDEGEPMELQIPDDRLSPEDELERKELRDAVRTAMDSLPEDCRRILTLRELGGMSYDELASTLGIEVGTVKSRLNRARKKLCARLLESGNFSAAAASIKQ